METLKEMSLCSTRTPTVQMKDLERSELSTKVLYSVNGKSQSDLLSSFNISVGHFPSPLTLPEHVCFNHANVRLPDRILNPSMQALRALILARDNGGFFCPRGLFKY